MISKKRLMPYFENFIPGPTGPVNVGAISLPAPTPTPTPTPAPAPAPAPVNPYAPDRFKTGAKGKKIPIGVHGNRLDTAKGRAKEAQMLQEEQIRIANHAMKVAASERVHGREDEANKAGVLAKRAADKAVAVNKAHVADVNRRTGSNLKPSATLQKFAEDVGPSKIPGTPIKPEPKAPDTGGGDTGGGDTGGGVNDNPAPKQPTPKRPTAPIIAPPPPPPKIVKNPNRDVLDLSRDEFSVSSIDRLLFEQVGSIELTEIARRDTIEGQNPYYSLISNLSRIRKEYEPTRLISEQLPEDITYPDTPEPEPQPPSPPTGLKIVPGNSELSLFWTPVQNNAASEISGYRIESSEDLGVSWNIVIANTQSTNTSYLVDSLSSSASYIFRVYAINEVGLSGPSLPSGVGIPIIQPTAPTAVSAIPGDKKILLSWNTPSSNGGSAIIGYRIQYSSDNGSTWTTAISNTNSTRESSIISGLTNNTTYIFRVYAINSIGLSSASDTSNLVTPVPPKYENFEDPNNTGLFYYIAKNGDLVINIENLQDFERVEIEIANNGTINLVDEA